MSGWLPLQRRLLARAAPALPFRGTRARPGGVLVPRNALSRQEKAQLMAGVHPQHSLAVARVLDQVSPPIPPPPSYPP